ncbi:MAG: DUF4363 family protein [Eubacteriales bacterium]|nr:DUF4363 family protein [Eubacteriales bacterium]
MKRCWFGAGLLIVLLIVSLGVTWGMDKIHEPIAADLKQAAECAEFGDWHNAEHFSRQAEEAWNKWEHFRACFADHTPTEEIGAELAAMDTARQERETGDFAASCARAAKMVQAVGDAHALCWWNLL